MHAIQKLTFIAVTSQWLYACSNNKCTGEDCDGDTGIDTADTNSDTDDNSDTDTDTDTDSDTDTDTDSDTQAPPLEECQYELDLLHGEAFEPAVVRTYFRATCDGESYAELDATHFVISENGEPLEQSQSNQSFVFDNFGRAYANVLLVDVSNTMLETDVFANLQSAAIEMFEDIAHGQYWAIYAFDGSESLTEVVAFSSDQLELNASVSSMAELEVTETSTNLNGAILLGLDELNG